MRRAFMRECSRVALSIGAALCGGLAVFGLLVAASSEPDPHTHFIVAAGVGAPVGAILATIAVSLAPSHRWRHLLRCTMGSILGAVVGVIVGRLALDLLGVYGLVVYVVMVGLSTYGGAVVATALPPVHFHRPPRST